jgi:hypothetical protein
MKTFKTGDLIVLFSEVKEMQEDNDCLPAVIVKTKFGRKYGVIHVFEPENRFVFKLDLIYVAKDDNWYVYQKNIKNVLLSYYIVLL